MGGPARLFSSFCSRSRGVRWARAMHARLRARAPAARFAVGMRRTERTQSVPVPTIDDCTRAFARLAGLAIIILLNEGEKGKRDCICICVCARTHVCGMWILCACVSTLIFNEGARSARAYACVQMFTHARALARKKCTHMLQLCGGERGAQVSAERRRR